MELRSGKKINFNTDNQPFKLILLNDKINFNKSSEEWRKNKIHLGNGQFIYKDNKNKGNKN